VQCPTDWQPRDWRKDDVELFVATVCLCVDNENTKNQVAKRLLNTIAYWSITQIDDGEYSLVVNSEGREWNTTEPLPLAAAVRSIDSESTEGTGGDLQLTANILDRAKRLDVHLAKSRSL
jgi:hypothetical protein